MARRHGSKGNVFSSIDVGRLWAVLLLGVIVLGATAVMALVTPEVAEAEDEGTDVTPVRVADPSTTETFDEMLGGADDGGRYAGRVWSDKSVTAASSVTLDSRSRSNPTGTTTVSMDPADDDGYSFLTTYSAMGSSRVVNGQSNSPIDLVMMLDVSTSMSSTDWANGQGRGPIVQMVSSANQLIDRLMSLNPQNRVAVVAYAGGTYTVLPLGHYTPKTQGTYLTLNQVRSGNGTSSTVNKWWNSISSNVQGRTNAGNPYFYADSTYLQGALAEGMGILANNTDTTYTDPAGVATARVPAIMVLSDGGTNQLTTQPTTSAQTNNWWNPITGTLRTYGTSGNGRYWPQLNGNPLYYGVSATNSSSAATIANQRSFVNSRVLGTLMTAGYMEKAIDARYVDPQTGKATGLRGYSVALNASGLGPVETEELNATLNPGQYFTASNSAVSGAWGAFQNYLKGQTPAVAYGTANSTWLNTLVRGTWYPVQLPRSNPYGVTNFTSASDLDYIDKAYSADDSSLSGVFDQIVTDVSNTAFHPVGDTVESGTTSAITYDDPIGRYMEVRNVNKVILWGNAYDVRKVNDTTWTIANPTTVTNPDYIRDTPVNLADLTMTLTEDANGSQSFHVSIPEAMLPLRVETVNLGQGVDAATGGQPVLGRASNASVASPLRVVYTVGLDKDVLNDDGTVDLSQIDPAYREAHTDDQGRLDFYSNLYTTGADGELTDYGDASTTFSPSRDNRFYRFQDIYQVYGASTASADERFTSRSAAEATLSDPIASVADLADDGTYYLLESFYDDKTLNGQAIPVTSGTGTQETTSKGDALYEGQEVFAVVRRTGAELKGIVNGHGQTVSVPASVADVNGSCRTVPGTARLGRMEDFAFTKTANATATAPKAEAPVYVGDGVTLADHLGNNGRLAIPARTVPAHVSLQGTKSLTGKPLAEGQFSFTITPGETNPAADPLQATTVTNGADGTFTLIDDAEYTEPGTYRYVIAEEIPEDTAPGISYDPSLYTVTVTVTDEAGTLQATTAIARDGEATDAVAFSNSYDPQAIALTIPGVKLLDGGKLSGGEFTFRLEPVSAVVDEGAGEEVTQGTETQESSQTATVSGPATVEGTVTTPETTGGTEAGESPQATEASADEGDPAQLSDLILDPAAEKATTVGDDAAVAEPAEGTTSDAATSVAGDDATKATSAPGETQDAPSSDEGSVLGDGAADATAEADGEDTLVVPMPAEDTATNSADGSFNFGSITFTRPGTYTYRVVEVAGDADGVTYDQTVHTVTVKVIDTDAVLSAEVSVADGDEVAFHNHFDPPQLSIHKDQHLDGGDFTTDQLTATDEDIATYRLTIHNAGTTPAHDVVVTDAVPEGLTYVEDSASDGGTEQDGVLIWDLGTIAGGETRQVTFQCHVPLVIEETLWVNVASMTFSNNPEGPETPVPSNEVEIREDRPSTTNPDVRPPDEPPGDNPGDNPGGNPGDEPSGNPGEDDEVLGSSIAPATDQALGLAQAMANGGMPPTGDIIDPLLPGTVGIVAAVAVIVAVGLTRHRPKDDD